MPGIHHSPIFCGGHCLFLSYVMHLNFHHPGSPFSYAPTPASTIFILTKSPRSRLPVMLAARKLDGEDPKVVLYLRCAYAAVQTVAVFIVLFIYFKANAASKDSANAVKIYVTPPPQVSYFCHIFFRHLWRCASLAMTNDK